MTSFLMSPRKQVFWSFCCSFFDVRMEMLHLAFYISNMRQEVQFSSVAQLRLTLCNPMGYTACQASLSITNSWSLLKLMSITLVMPSNHLILCHPLLSCVHSFPASGSFQMSWFFTSGAQIIGVSTSASVLPINI